MKSGYYSVHVPYRHFHEGDGAKREFSYERYVNNDESGWITLNNAILEAQHGIVTLWNCNDLPDKFNFTGPPIFCGDTKKKYNRKHFPYPATENWQKAIGAHYIWITGHVTVTYSENGSSPTYDMDMYLHAEDLYNFNPNQADIATGTKDAENGRFVIVGLASGYFQQATLLRKVRWTGNDLGQASILKQVHRR
ncbi:hypothetical protein N9J26_01170 [bacterium]|nr:hypothetical protein [bacterium]